MKENIWRFLAVALLLAATLTASRLGERRNPESLGQPLEAIPTRLGEWTLALRQPGPLTLETLTVLKPTSYLNRQYHRQGRPLALFVAYYAQQRAGESMHSPKNCLPGNGWEVWNYATDRVPVEGEPVTVNKYSVRNETDRMLVVYWYQSRSRIIASEYWGKVCLVRDAIVDGRTAASIVKLTLPDVPGALEDARAFAALVIPEMQACLNPAR